ncbi:peptide/nickel transport system substrate-binding protein [Rhizobiales bacterium GAS113]|nr:peptide/nickel transport system substrate-binding protein [Rhizobiales bacterium GAS113]
MSNLTRRGVVVGATASLAALGSSRPASAQAAKKILIIASNQDIPNFDPHVANGYSAAMLLRNTYDSLVRVEGNPPKPVPHLALSWTISPDGMEYVFTLDPAAKFHDGSPVTGEAVRYSFNRLLRLGKGNSWMIAGIVDQNSVSAQDAGNVKIKLLKPFTAFLQVLPWIWVVNPPLVEANLGSDDGQNYLRANFAASGAFRLRRAEAGNLYEFERTPNAWKTGGGNLTGAIWKIVRETSSQRLMLQRGDAHIAVDLTAEDMDALKGKPGVVEVVEPEYRTFSIKMNTRNGPFTDINLRKAVSYAVNYQALLDADGGYAQLMTGPLPTGILGFDSDLQVYRTDLAKAKEFLAKSSAAKGGVKLTYDYVSGLDQERRFGLVLLDAVKQLGLDLEIKAKIWPDLVAQCAKPETTSDFFPVYQTANYGDPDNIAFAAYDSSRNGSWQNPVYSNPAVDKLIAQGRSEMDDTKRKAIYVEFQKTVVADAPDIFGVLENRKLALRSDVKGFKFTPIASNAVELFPLSLP